MLGEIGIMFGFKGGPEAIRMMNRLKGEYGALSSSVDTGAGRISAGFSRMASGIKTGALAATAAMTALTAAAIAIPYKLAQSRAELSNEQANLRALGLDDKAIDTFESAAEVFSTKVAGVTKTAYTKAAYDVVSAFANISAEEQGKITDMALITGKATKMSAESATKLFGSLWGAAGDEIKAKGAEPFVQKWSGAIYTAVKELKTTGEELAAAAKHSISMLTEAGWSPEMMTGFWGQLITSGLSGEAAGTALKQMAVKERGAFGKLIAKASGQMIDTEFMKGDAKARAEAWNKGLIEGAGKIGSDLFKSDPVKWLDKMGTAFEKLKANGEDYKKFLGEIFGEEQVNAMVQFFEKRGQLKKTVETIAKGSYGDVRRIVEEQMSKGIGPATAIMSQLWQNLKQTMGKTMSGLVTPVFGWLGSKLLQANALWKALFGDLDPIARMEELQRVGGDALADLYERLKGLPGNIGAFVESFKTSFSEAFKSVGGLGDELKRIVDLLGNPDPEKWKQIGAELGNIAGLNLDRLKEQLSGFKQFAADLWGPLKPIAEGLGYLAGKAREGYQLYEQHVLPELTPMYDKMTAQDQADLSWGKKKFESGVLGLPPQQEPDAFPGFNGPRAPMTRRLRGASGGEAAGAAQAMPQPQVQVDAPKVDVSVKIGERELKDYIVEVFQRESARKRQGAGDGFEMGMF